MTRFCCTRTPARRGVALIITLIFLALFACLALAIASSAGTTLLVARNRIDSTQAAALAEAGLQLVQRQLGGLAVPGTHSAVDLHQAIAAHLETTWASSTMIEADDIWFDAAGVVCPPITANRPDGRAGTIQLTLAASGGALDDTTITILSTGRFGQATRTSRYNMTVQRGRSAIGIYGIASKSPIQMTGNARITGLNEPDEGSVLSATYSVEEAIRLTGNVNISGDVGVCNPEGRIRKTGNIHIGGDQITGADEPEWPEVDPSVFRPYATNVYSGNGSGNLTLSNIIIPPNTNPTFSGNITIRGVVYIQSPNRVKFTGNANLIGVVVCEPPAVDNLSSNQVHFTGNLSVSSVANLPAGAQYDGLRDLTGSFLLAPGYSAKFTGNFSTVSGCMVASAFDFSGNAGGVIRGGIVNLRDSSFQMTGNTNLRIDRENAVENPAGLTSSIRLVCVSGSYAE